MNSPQISIVIPVYNEAANLETLHARLKATLDGVGRPYEVIYTDDGSADESLAILKRLGDRHPEVVVVELSRNFGQHAAIFAGFAQVRGEVVVTLDADLQNPPEEIPKLLARIDEGCDAAGGWRRSRRDTWFRRWASRQVNRVMSRVTGVVLNDYGCMLRAYRREIVDQMAQCREISSFIPALANLFARRVEEVEVEHAERERGESKYGLFKLLKLNFDLMTGFSLAPIQVVSWLGVLIALCGVGFGLFLFVRRLIVGPEVEGVFTLFAILFVFVGLQLLALGLIGEYIGRIYAEVRQRPRYVVRAVHRQGGDG
jgi:undecaprenyl-phosphate 4-deoxy-4-formamido-L-arabinose transferase